MTGELLIRWTIRLALACYVVVLALAVIDGRCQRWQRVARVIWTTGLSFFVAHVIFAFHFVHRWSHSLAYEHTANETQLLFGWRFGEGIYFNYAFTVLWITDAAWWWRRRKLDVRRPGPLDWLIHGYMLLIVFNAVVVFEDGPLRWCGLAACVSLVLLLIWQVVAKKGVEPDHDSTRSGPRHDRSTGANVDH